LRVYLGGADFRQLGLTLAILAAARPWETMTPVAEPGAAAPPEGDPPDGGEIPAEHLAAYAARALKRRHARLLAPGDVIESLPTPDLHVIRLDAKRMRYAAEFFAPLFPGRHTRRFLRRLTMLQERLGHLNDGAVAADLLADIKQDRAYAGGVVRGFVAAGTAGARGKIGRSWRRFRRQEAFWS
jgi:hypothetical protein